jgi:hypothetical protein
VFAAGLGRRAWLASATVLQWPGYRADGQAMPILIVIKRSRPRLFRELRRLVARPGLVGVLLERRRHQRRRSGKAIVFGDRRSVSLRQPLDADNARTWAGPGFVLLKVHALPDTADAPVPRAARSAARPSPRARRASRPARRRRTR